MPAPAIIVHGGAGGMRPEDDGVACAEGCLEAARAGFEMLRQGGEAIEAAETAARVLEDIPIFNAGVGSALNIDGEVEHDAMIMDGATLAIGGVCAVKGFRNPILIARAVMEDSPHILLAGPGAAKFAKRIGFSECASSELMTDAVLQRWRLEKEQGWPRRPGTIGAVAIDSHGHVAAATSTGGISGKLAGRVGDAPMVGCGTYADDGCGAASATGHGESIARVVMAKHACDLMERGNGAQQAAVASVERLDNIAGEGGIIVVSPRGDIGAAFNSERMSRAWIDQRGEGSGFGPD